MRAIPVFLLLACGASAVPIVSSVPMDPADVVAPFGEARASSRGLTHASPPIRRSLFPRKRPVVCEFQPDLSGCPDDEQLDHMFPFQHVGPPIACMDDPTMGGCERADRHQRRGKHAGEAGLAARGEAGTASVNVKVGAGSSESSSGLAGGDGGGASGGKGGDGGGPYGGKGGDGGGPYGGKGGDGGGPYGGKGGDGGGANGGKGGDGGADGGDGGHGR